MKTFVTTLAALFVSAIAFSQTPPTLKEENLKGNVHHVIYTICRYSENFGEPREGERRLRREYYYDSHGRAVLFSLDNTYFWVRYNQEGNNTITSMLEFYSNKEFENLEDFTTENYITDKFFFHDREITYNSDNVVTKYDVYDNTNGSYKLKYRKTAKFIGNGTYECKLYGPNGNTKLDYKETYNSKGQLTMLDNPKEYNRVSIGESDIEIPHAGTYKYNNKGQLVSYEEQRISDPKKLESVYNEHGDVIEQYKSTIYKGVASNKTLTATYVDYQYDDKGNWIYRILSDGKKKYLIERRQIEYYNSAEELDSMINNVYSNFPVFSDH